ncbi:50S ribosomal protein L24, partial [Candidatus Woesearchaeota archaeon]|nr:50S ribosomal protein L24 [Candidatus Woesearchaeota archaeon]
MKQVHSTKWKSSTQPRKQRKYVHNLPDHLIGTQLQVHLSKPLREKHGVRATRVRVGDKVKVLRGTHKGKEGKVERVDTMNRRVIVAKIEVDKKQGGSAPYPLQPSNLTIIEATSDKRRFKKTATKAPVKQAAPKAETKE